MIISVSLIQPLHLGVWVSGQNTEETVRRQQAYGAAAQLILPHEKSLCDDALKRSE